MKRLAVIGSFGMLGSDLVHFFRPHFHVTGIHKDNYRRHVGHSFDVVVNANGNSKRFWANEHPIEDFEASTVSVYKSLVDFPHKTYVYISSSDVYADHTSPRTTKEQSVKSGMELSPYGFHKYISEQIVAKYAAKYLILRSSMILGKNLKKGPVYDMLHGVPLFITKTSQLQMITTREIAKIISYMIAHNVRGETYNMGGTGVVDFRTIESIVGSRVSISKGATKQMYEMNVSKLHKVYKLKTSTAYLQEFLQTYR